MATKNVIPIHRVESGQAAKADDSGARLERAGYVRMMMIGEPHLSEFAEKYKAKGYDVEVVLAESEQAGGESNSPAFGAIFVRKPEGQV